MKTKYEFNHKETAITLFPKNGKKLPQAEEAEELVLGTCLVYPDSIHEIELKPDMFFRDAHQKIFAAIQERANKGIVDLITVTDYLRQRDQLDSVGGPSYLTYLTSRVFSDQMINTYALLVKQAYLQREYVRFGFELANIAYTEDLLDITEFAESSLFKLSDITQVKEPRQIGQVIDSLLKDVESIYNKEKILGGVPSGFNSIDRITGGWNPGNMIIIAGRPSMGKTALALTLASNPAFRGYPVCFFSLEMSDLELATRYLSGVSGYTNVEIRNARIDFERLCIKSDEIATLPIYVDDTQALSLFELRSKVKKMILRHSVKLVVIDYLQLMSAEAGNREQEVSIISRGLKAIAKEFNIPVIALSQLNRGVEDRADKRPRLADLRESGSIEQDADIVCFISRPAYYKISSIQLDGKDISTNGLMLIDCAKDRNGALFTIGLYHNDSLTLINENME